MSQSVSAAVLIGVSDYSAYDRSVGNAVGTSNLFSIHNNLRMSWDMVRALGFNPSDIALLSSPLASLIDAHPGIYGEATRQMVLDSVAALARKLASCDVARGTIHFSGHGGSVSGVGPVIAVSDTVVEDGQLTNYVALSEIVEILVKNAPGKPVTMLLDSCGSGLFPRIPGKTRMGRLRAIARLRDRDILISSTSPHQVGAEVEINGKWYGALTWAISRASYQYYRRVEDNIVFYDLSTQTLFDRAVELMQGLSLTQTPQLSGMANTIVLQPSGIENIKPTNKLRDGGRGGLEISATESGGIIQQGNEESWTVFKVFEYGTNIEKGTLTTAYNTTQPGGSKYSDFWSVDPINLPIKFYVKWYGDNVPPPGAVGMAQDMYAFSPLVSPNQTYSADSSDTVWWVMFDDHHNGLYYSDMFLIRKQNGDLIWLMSAHAFDNHSNLLPLLPSFDNQGGKTLQIPSGQGLYFERWTPGGPITGVSIGYSVKAASNT